MELSRVLLTIVTARLAPSSLLSALHMCHLSFFLSQSRPSEMKEWQAGKGDRAALREW
ncbi:hypothetical protein DAI22_07g093100 [Oryza sativa Japonica Group]|nr:hypothetical protein DAI22_07g093100 [Oryza sativa Japonica Group]